VAAPSDNHPRRPLRAIYDWLKGPASTTDAADARPSAAPRVPVRLGHYLIERTIGEGGMGVVYAARDERLHRSVALKTMTSLSREETARKRFWREARAAAAVNHPNVCQIYEIGEDEGDLFIAMELLEGRPLSDRLKDGPMNVSEAVNIARGILAALAALHARGIVHRDLKPSNVFLTPHGVKLLDFGLARTPAGDGAQAAPDLTRVGAVMGTPRYMAPEQAIGGDVDARTDLFSAGSILFEMLAGRPAFIGETVVAVLHATVHEHPPALKGTPAVAAVDRVIRRALAKRREDRPATADAMADELRDITAGDDTATIAHALVRLVVLPFRILRPDPETDFLAFSLADAITTSLSGIASLVVRSSATAAKFSIDTPDFKALAVEAGVDRVVTGTLVRAGDQLRVVAQLVEAPGGTVISSETVQAPLGDLFQLQDDIARRIVSAMALPLGGATPSPSPDAPQNARAYELYLRANELARSYDGLAAARDLYERCIALDPEFAPAWARLGRCHRVIGKYIEASTGSEARAEEALRRALDINPRLTIAHKIYANLEADTGKADRAVVRLLAEATRHGNDPELFAGLVHACRYCGLYEESLIADAEARRLDPNVATSIEQTILMTGDIERLLGTNVIGPIAGADDAIRVIGLGLAGRRDEARALLGRIGPFPRIPLFQIWTTHLQSWLDRRIDEMLADLVKISSVSIFDDPEALFQEGWLLCDVGEYEKGFSYLERAVSRGYFVAPTLRSSPQFDGLRANPAFASLVADAEAGRLHAANAFKAAGGHRLLGRSEPLPAGR
jgi:serine/threonine protein kinase/tetratricopeptide (TPR) repeat protein